MEGSGPMARFDSDGCAHAAFQKQYQILRREFLRSLYYDGESGALSVSVSTTIEIVLSLLYDRTPVFIVGIDGPVRVANSCDARMEA